MASCVTRGLRSYQSLDLKAPLHKGTVVFTGIYIGPPCIQLLPTHEGICAYERHMGLGRGNLKIQ